MSTNTLRLITGGGLVLVLAFAVGCRYPQEEERNHIRVQDHWVEDLIKTLASENIESRDKAVRELVGIGKSAVPKLHEALNP